jgi:hypothetical protein
VASWWGEAGRPGWAPDLWLGAAWPQALAGLAVGGWRLSEPGRAPQGMPWPGVVVARSPLAGVDSLVVEPEDGGWTGYAGALTELRALSLPKGRHTRATFGLLSGSPNVDENALVVERGDSLSGMLAENQTGRRGDVGPYDLLGRHRWGVSGRSTRGRHQFDGSFAQRGVGSRLKGGEEESATGESGHLGYTYRAGATRARAQVARGHDAHESVGGVLPYSRRDAQETAASVDLGRTHLEDGVELRGAWTHGKVSRTKTGAFEREISSWWGAARGWAPLGSGRLTASLGAGHHAAVHGVEVAPSLAYQVRAGALNERLAIDRTLDPVWSDVTPGVAPFLQRTWSATASTDWTPTGAWRAGVRLQGGRTSDRALVQRLPLEEQWLRAGVRRDARPYAFLLTSGHAAWERGPFGLDVEGFALAHTDRSTQPQVDPGAGIRLSGEARFKAFQGDLGVTLRAGIEGVGSRESESSPSATLPGYASYAAAAEVTLADAVIAIRAKNLESHRRPETWVDSATGLLARSPGREVRFSLTWRLFN